uniref:Cytochrome P450 n=1 Tax=Timema tahoe TaxID=61484 RepID=A0A7R9FJH5_9NEOP|nr:unnamed protein product [Timema tahoe]
MGLIFDSLYVDVAVGAATLLVLICIFYSYAYGYWRRRNITYIPAPFSIFGNVGDMIFMKKTPALVMRDLYNKLDGEPYGGIFIGATPIMLIRDPEVIKQVFVKNFTSFMDRHLDINEKVNPVEENLFFMKGEKWRWLRSKLTPTFSSGKLKMMFQVLTECASEMNTYVESIASKQESIEMRELFAQYNTEIIGSCAFGIKFNTINNPKSEFRAIGRTIFDQSFFQMMKGLIITIFPGLAKCFTFTIFDLKTSRFFRGIVEDTIAHREKNEISRNDFLQLLIQLKKKGYVTEDSTQLKEDAYLYYKIGDEGSSVRKEFDKTASIVPLHCHLPVSELTDGLLAAQCFVFFLAGFETSSAVASFCMYELALNPDIQERVREEVDAVLKEHNGAITYEAVQKMGYLGRVVDETLRKYPTIPILERKCTRPFTFPGTDYVMEKGAKLSIPSYAIQHDPQYYPDPERFDPERFTEEAKQSRHPFTYLPFGEGPRICIGMRFALMQIKVGLVSLLSKYEFSPCEKTDIPIVLLPKAFFLTPTNGIWLKITNRD